MLEPDESRRMKLSDIRASEYFKFGPMGHERQEQGERQPTAGQVAPEPLPSPMQGHDAGVVQRPDDLCSSPDRLIGGKRIQTVEEVKAIIDDDLHYYMAAHGFLEAMKAAKDAIGDQSQQQPVDSAPIVQVRFINTCCSSLRAIR